MTDRPTMHTHGVALPWARRGLTKWLRSSYYRVAMGILRATFAPTKVAGAEHFVDLGPCVIVANHTSHADTMTITGVIPAATRSNLVVAAAADYFFGTKLTRLLSTVFVGAIPIHRDKVSRVTLDLFDQMLTEGHSVLIFPEGGRSPDGEIREFKTGPAWIARRGGVPVVPIHLSGARDILPKGKIIPRRKLVTVNIGEPMDCGEKETAKAFSARIEARVRELASTPANLATSTKH